MTSRTYSASAVQRDATEIADVSLAMSRMASGIKTPKAMAWRFYDAARGRVAQPLGPYPEMAEECIDNGGHYHFIVHPLEVMKAHIRRRCRSKLPEDMKPVLLSLKKECDSAEATALALAFSGNLPSASDLAASIKADDDAIIALERAKEIEQDKLVALTEGK